MKKFMKITLVAVFVLFTAVLTQAQDWSKDQTEVWKVVQDSWKGWKTGNIDAIAASVHEKYQGWSDDSPLPIGKQSMIEFFNSMKSSMTINYYNIEPARILVLKSSAVVDYYYDFNITWKMGDEVESKTIKGKIVEFYVNEGGKWLLLGDMMVHEKDDGAGDD
jgi:hypothetical protein